MTLQVSTLGSGTIFLSRVQVKLLLRLGQSKSYLHGTRYCRGILNGRFVSKVGYRQGHLCLLTNPHLSLMYQETPSNDQAFLVATLGDALREGLTQLVIKSPPDPIDFLANFLKSYSMKRCSPLSIKQFATAPYPIFNEHDLATPLQPSHLENTTRIRPTPASKSTLEATAHINVHHPTHL
ncbi:hypothetical protein ECG_09338 [Echinococcus granulosus]|uniref:Dpy-30 domain containing protein n=1 Tax=Echinococcus granulosus TaxID=6210 RepID=A0A068WXZ6_ECHGR|nr:hypothetical protein ECG_09338 [Echinococcus granulosus]CDS23320.1 Dpy-30 domain containing protein [Echinococcus granulosus]